MGRLNVRNTARGKQMTSSVLVTGLLVALLAPLDLVVCMSADGHAAIENAWLGCCEPGAGAQSCAPSSALKLTGGLPAEDGVSSAPCNDYRLGAAARASFAGRPHAQQAAPVRNTIGSDLRVATLLRRFEPDPDLGRQLRETLGSTVLTL